MTTDLVDRLRELADYRSKIASRRKEEMEEWRAAAAIEDLGARLRLAEKRADDAEARNDFLIKELDKLIEKARQS